MVHDVARPSREYLALVTKPGEMFQLKIQWRKTRLCEVILL